MGRSEHSVEEVREGPYELLATVRHEDLIPFVLGYFFRRTSWITGLHHALSLAALASIVTVAVARDIAFLRALAHFGLGTLVMLVLVVPLHEALHALAYWLCGARDIRFAIVWRMMAAYVAADRFVAGRRAFVFVALTPFVGISTGTLVLVVADPKRAVVWLTLLLWHTAGVSGDWALLNYYWLNRRREIFTFDEDGVSYFYARTRAEVT